jgi:hypothetical protein
MRLAAQMPLPFRLLLLLFFVTASVVTPCLIEVESTRLLHFMGWAWLGTHATALVISGTVGHVVRVTYMLVAVSVELRQCSCRQQESLWLLLRAVVEVLPWLLKAVLLERIIDHVFAGMSLSVCTCCHWLLQCTSCCTCVAREWTSSAGRLRYFANQLMWHTSALTLTKPRGSRLFLAKCWLSIALPSGMPFFCSTRSCCCCLLSSTVHLHCLFPSDCMLVYSSFVHVGSCLSTCLPDA